MAERWEMKTRVPGPAMNSLDSLDSVRHAPGRTFGQGYPCGVRPARWGTLAVTGVLGVNL
ncbi:hypothetical protein GCM10010502_31050 [Kitasatospora aureofaciens]|uniref:Uncharacterized protein n=1 Tax=Kitasatospora aureofaciens TaxID=1894 RepID=A0A8H9HTC3_KITAU|nr:hypothetical protein GCM10010502_31050 [Kitasatospora aureofaciens]